MYIYWVFAVVLVMGRDVRAWEFRGGPCPGLCEHEVYAQVRHWYPRPLLVQLYGCRAWVMGDTQGRGGGLQHSRTMESKYK